jgi:2-keto-3-deoxy-L-rhamnonate aldolase RhmA
MIAELRQNAVLQLLANAGFDWIIIDNEHGSFTAETISELSRAARWLDIAPIVRVPVIGYQQITQALDGGAQGIMLPRVRRVDEVELAVQAMKYPPEGSRGSAQGRGQSEFRSGDVSVMMAEANRETFLVVQVETREALENLDALLSVTGVDAALVGPNDLAIALGVPGRMRDPALERAVETVQAACARQGVHAAIHTNDIQLTGEWAHRGIRMVSINSEVGFLSRSAKESIDSIRQAGSGVQT